MKRTEELLREKRRLGLKETISQREKEELQTDKPIQKIIGFIDFDDLKIFVNHDVLIPRYETQEVVIKALELIKKNDKVLDLCTGSGYIGLTIKQKVETASVVLADIDRESIKQCHENSQFNKLDVTIIQSDLFKNINGKFNVIISNPPYIPNKNKLDKSVINFEPSTALFGGKDGNDFYKRIINEAPEFLLKNGYLIFEISEDNSQFLEQENFRIFKDINDKKRIAIKQF